MRPAAMRQRGETESPGRVFVPAVFKAEKAECDADMRPRTLLFLFLPCAVSSTLSHNVSARRTYTAAPSEVRFPGKAPIRADYSRMFEVI